jgi:hypothetical protein
VLAVTPQIKGCTQHHISLSDESELFYRTTCFSDCIISASYQFLRAGGGVDAR